VHCTPPHAGSSPDGIAGRASRLHGLQHLRGDFRIVLKRQVQRGPSPPVRRITVDARRGEQQPQRGGLSTVLPHVSACQHELGQVD